MSHCATVDVQFKDIQILEQTCKRIGVRAEKVTNYKFYDGTIVSGLAVYLPNWRYPAVVKDNGEIIYDNYNGHWGNEQELNEVKQYYGLEKAKKQARLKGYSYREQKGSDGQVKLIVTI